MNFIDHCFDFQFPINKPTTKEPKWMKTKSFAFDVAVTRLWSLNCSTVSCFWILSLWLVIKVPEFARFQSKNFWNCNVQFHVRFYVTVRILNFFVFATIYNKCFCIVISACPFRHCVISSGNRAPPEGAYYIVHVCLWIKGFKSMKLQGVCMSFCLNGMLVFTGLLIPKH